MLTLAEGMVAMLGGSIPRDRVPDLVVAWQDVTKKYCDPSKSKVMSSHEPTNTSNTNTAGPNVPSTRDLRCQICAEVIFQV